MSRVALVIGCGVYANSALCPLPGAIRDGNRVHKVLTDPKLGNYDVEGLTF
jgi:hypothetical protein